MKVFSPTQAVLAVLALGASSLHPGAAEPPRILWQIGQPDQNNAEFALAPKSYDRFKEDVFFVVGKSDPKRDWPYAHPGPADSWAGGRQHSFSIMFGVKEAVAHGAKTHTAPTASGSAGSAP